MNMLTDATFILATLNFLTMAGNIYYFSKIGKMRATTDIINSLNAELSAKDKMLQERINDADNYKRQYDALLIDHKNLEGELRTYHSFHGHTKQL